MAGNKVRKLLAQEKSQKNLRKKWINKLNCNEKFRMPVE